MSTNRTGASENPPAAITTDQAITRARRMLVQASLLHHSAEKVATAQGPAARDEAEQVLKYDQNNHLAATTPDVLIPVLEALISAAEKSAVTEKS